MKKKLILKILAGVLVVAGAVGAGIVIGKVNSDKKDSASNEVSIQKDTGDIQDNNGNTENKDNDGAKDATMPSKSEEVDKAPTTNDKTLVSNNEKPKVEQNTTTKNENKDTGTAKEEASNGVYKPGISRERLDEVKDSYYKQMGEVRIYFGRHFESTGELIFPDEKIENDNYTKKFYDMTDEVLNSLWGNLKTILSDNEMKKLTQEQVQWIKEKDNINKEETGILTAKANTLYARGKDTYKRCIYLANKYLDY